MAFRRRFPLRRRRRFRRVARGRATKRYVTRKVRALGRNIETKWFDRVQDFDNVTDAGAMFTLNSVPNIGEVTTGLYPLREGRMIRNTSLLLRLSLTTAPWTEDVPTQVPPESYVRVIVFWDAHPHGVGPDLLGSSADSLLDNFSNAGALVSAPVWTFRNFMTIKRYKIFYDRVFKIFPRAGGVGTTGETVDAAYTYNQIYLNKRFKLGRTSIFNSVEGIGVQYMNTNSLHVAVLNNHTTGNNWPQTDVRCSSRIYYRDS